MPVGRRSRVGDAIMLFDSPALAENLKKYDEDHRFQINSGFTVTIRGGDRDTNGSLTQAITTSILNSAAAAGYNPTL